MKSNISSIRRHGEGMVRILATLIFLFMAPGCATSKRYAAPNSVPMLMRDGEYYLVRVPNVSWIIEFPAGELQVLGNEPDKGYFVLAHRSMLRAIEIWKRGGTPEESVGVFREAATGKIVMVSLWVDSAAKCDNDASKCSELVMSRFQRGCQMQQRDGRVAQSWQSGEWYVFDYFLKPKDKDPSHGVHAVLVRDGVWVHFHISKPSQEDNDLQLFRDFVDAVRLVTVTPLR